MILVDEHPMFRYCVNNIGSPAKLIDDPMQWFFEGGHREQHMLQIEQAD
jgi:hypothetical protein